MSRIGNRTLLIPDGVSVENINNVVTVKGPKGELSFNVDKTIKVEIDENEVTVTRSNELKKSKQLHGTTNAIISNMIEGVKHGFEKALEISGVGYRFNVKGKQLVISAGYSHQVELLIPDDLVLEVISNTEIVVKGINKEKVGEFAAQIRKVKKPEPYKGKGIHYKGEHIRRKEGKKASK
ncbi:MAG TPA: 50S ribosomal protein L6 [Bacilli bacterium]|nr:50S ribosomal protein L6 [Bacilli bacterium]